MNGSLIVDVTVGLFLMYLVVALFCTVIQEWIAQLFKLRAKNLEKAIILLLSKDVNGSATKADASKEANDVLNHPLFKKLAPGSKPGIRTAKDRPSYVTSTNFALALIDVLVSQRDGNAAPQQGENGGPKTDGKDNITFQTLQRMLTT
jgi:hypothetical protein